MWKEEGKKPILEFLIWTFLISWGCEFVIIVWERSGLLPTNIEKLIVMFLIGLGAGLAPAYGSFIILKRHQRIIGIKDYFRRIIECKSIKLTIITAVVIMGYQLLKCLLTEQSLDNPWYCYIVFIPLMIFGGGLEELGWRGFLQPALEEKMGFIPAVVVQGLVWTIWHTPLWFILNANQSNFNYISFMMYCISFSFSLALLYRITRCVAAVIILHAWGNVVLGGMFTYHSLTSFPGTKTVLLYLIEIVISCMIIMVIGRNASSKVKKCADVKQEKIIIISTIANGRQQIEEIVQDNEIEMIETQSYTISHCIGCNHCWIKTPGKCCIHDDFEKIFKKILIADKVVFVAEENLGFVSYQLKNIIDRLIAIDMPYTTIKNGQARHAARYNKSWKFMLLCPQAKNLTYLNEWLNRVAINFHSESLGAYQFSEKEEINHALYNH